MGGADAQGGLLATLGHHRYSRPTCDANVAHEFVTRQRVPMPKINGNEIRPGLTLDHEGGLWAAVKVDHVKPGKGGAFAQVELKNLRDGRKLNERFRSADKVETVELEKKDQQFLFETDGMLTFM